MDDLVEFLTARLNAAEETTHAAGESRIAWLTYRDQDGHMLYTTVADGHGGVWVADGKELPEPSFVHVVYETAQVLADIEAKRQIIHVERDRALDAGGVIQRRLERSAVLRLLAQPYASHPDYRSDWAP